MYGIDNVHTLCSIPATDLNFVSALKSATDEQVNEAISVMEQKKTGNKGRINACKKELKRRNRSK